MDLPHRPSSRKTFLIMKNPLVSVVIPAFRSGTLILESIESVMVQTFQDFEVVIVDNNASEETRAAIQKALEAYPLKIRVIHEPTQGNSSARNRGIREAKGIYVALLDDDDKMASNRLEKQIEAIEKNPEASIIHGRINYVAFDGITIVKANQSNDIQDWAQILFQDSSRFPADPPRSIAPSVSLFSKDLATQLGGFDERFNPCFVEDTEFSLRMWEQGPCIEIPAPLVSFRLPSPEFLRKKRENVSNWIRAARNLNLFFSILAQRYYISHSRESNLRFRKIRSRWLRELSQDVLKISDGQEAARDLLKRALLDQPFELKNWKWLSRSFLPRNQRMKTLKIANFPPKKMEAFIPQEDLIKFFRLPDE